MHFLCFLSRPFRCKEVKINFIKRKYELQNTIKLISVFVFHIKEQKLILLSLQKYVIEAKFLWVKMCSLSFEKFTADVTFTDPNLLCTKSQMDSSGHFFCVVKNSFTPAKNKGLLNGGCVVKILFKFEGNLCSSPLTQTIRFTVAGWPYFIGTILSSIPKSSISSKVLAPLGPAGLTVLGPCSKVKPSSDLVVCIHPPSL